MLAIATQNPDSIPETYVRQHTRMIAPGKTVVIFFEGKGTSLQKMKTFRVSRDSSLLFPLNKFFGLWHLFIAGYPGAVAGPEKERVIRFLKDNQVKALLAEFGPTGCALRGICKEAGIRLVVNFHGHDATVMPRRWVIRHSYRRLAEDANGFVCGSTYFAGRLRDLGFPKEKIHVIPCGIEVEQFANGIEKDPDLIVAVGRLVEKKAPHLTIAAFGQIINSFPSARLEIIGNGPLRDTCERKVKELGISSSVIFHGAKDHGFVKKKLARASVFLQHSVTASNGDTESQGISLLEAMASNVPVVTTRHNGFPETVPEGETGYLVDEGDVDGMAERIIMLLRNQELRDRMGKAGGIRVKKYYSSELQIKRLRKVLFM